MQAIKGLESKFAVCGCGGTGRRARLRIWFREEWGFKSLHPHHFFFEAQKSFVTHVKESEIE